jgi:hypothetical protein
MDATMFQILVALGMVVATVGMVVWFERYLAAASSRRRIDMMKRFALDPDVWADGGAEAEAMMKRVRKRCRKCQAEDYCERWLSGQVGGRNSFCPNAHVFRALARSARATT